MNAIFTRTDAMPSTQPRLRTTKTPLRCFVAMALEHPDTDKWFDKTLRPLLKSVGAQPRRVDRIEHNDDIDDRILAEIKAADFMVADLTYARPSVYFEAGFAQRKVSVVYTCRNDHLTAPSDPNRVHFDLQMKNIVPWREPLDRRFRRRIESRLLKVTLPLLRDKAKSVEAGNQAERFRGLSQTNQLAAVTSRIKAETSSLGMTTRSERERLQSWGIVLDPVMNLATRFHRGWQWQCLYLVVPSLTKQVLEYVRTELNLGRMAPTFAEAGKHPRGIVEFVLLVSLHQVPLERIRNAFSTWQIVGSAPKQFESRDYAMSLKPYKKPPAPRSNRRPADPQTIPVHRRLVVIDPVKSEEQAARTIHETLPTIRQLGKPPH